MTKYGFFFAEKKHEQIDQVEISIDKHLDTSENNLKCMLEIARRYSKKIDAKHIADLDLQDNPCDAADNIYKALMNEQQALASALKPKYKELCCNTVMTIAAMGALLAAPGAFLGFLVWGFSDGRQSFSAAPSIPAVTLGAEIGGGLGTCLGISQSISFVKEFIKSNSFIQHRTLKSDLLEFKRNSDEFFASSIQDQAAENRSIYFKR
jgi:hypothetical protein